MRTIIISIIFVAITINLIAQNDTIYATVDLKNMKNDMVTVTMNFNLNQNNNNAKFYFPISIQGTYDYMYYSKYCTDLKAFDSHNNPLTIKENVYGKTRYRKYFSQTEYKRIRKKHFNKFFIIPNQATTISYKVEDCYDIGNFRFGNFVPEASIFEKDKVYQINWGAVVGNFVSKENSIYKIKIIKPDKFYGATTIQKHIVNDTLDYIIAKNYNELINKPLFYTIPDTTTLQIGKSIIEITVFSEDGKKYSKILSKNMKPMIEKASQTFLKGIMPDKYIFMFYFVKRFGMGALEHKTTSVYFDVTPDTTTYFYVFLSTPAHEFLHILTPLTVRSNIINNFKFYSPQASKHLWMYEGITEYFSNILLLQTKDVKPRWFFRNMRWNIRDARKKTSLIKLSENIYKHNKEYDLVYSKGSFTAFALDLEIYKLTNGEKRLYDIMMLLKKEYKDKPFDDNILIDEFVRLSGNNQLHSFFDKYIIGTKKLPVNEYLEYIGCEYKTIVDTIKYKSPKIPYTQFYKDNRLYIYKPSRKYYPNVKGGRKIQITKINGNDDVMAHQKDLYELKEGDIIEYKSGNNTGKIVIKYFDVTEIRKQKIITKIENPNQKQKNTFKEFLNYNFEQ